MNARILICLACIANVAADAQEFRSKVHGAFFGALVADALSLGSHYEYDAKAIKQAYGGAIQSYLGPGERMGGSTHGVGWGRRNYHPGQRKGDGTDYGLYLELVLQYLASGSDPPRRNAPFDLDGFVPFWRARFEKPEGDPEYWGAWRCTQTRQALEKVQRGATDYRYLGGNSNAMAVRSAAFLGVHDNEDAAATASRVAMFTHRNPEALLGGEFFTRVAFRLAHDKTGKLTPLQAIRAVNTRMDNAFVREQVRKGIAKFEEVMDPGRPLGKEEFADDLAMTSMARLWDVGRTEPIKVGKASPTEGTMPSSIYIILKYSENSDDKLNNFVAAARANAMVGGDNASRAVAIGTVLGAYYGVERIVDAAHGGEAHLKTGLNAWPRCEAWLDKLPLLAESSSSGKSEL